MEVAVLTGVALAGALEDVARLRIEVFAAFPYLYDGDAAYERRYLRAYQDTPRAVVVVARDEGRIVGAATGMPLSDHADAAQIRGLVWSRDEIFYCAESVLLPAYRGLGIGHAFFDHREAEARRQGFAQTLFCAVARPEDHPLRPADYRPLDGFWRKRGYAPLEGVSATFHWTDIGETVETPHRLNAWGKALT